MSELTDKERDLAQRMADNPLDVFQGKSLGWLEDFIRITVGTPKTWTPPVGSPLIVLDDLTAETGEYVYTDAFGITYLYANGAAVSQTTYAALYAAWGANKWGADAGGNFLLLDARGRSLFFCGTNANADLGDNDGAAVADRQAKHAPAVSGAPGKGTLAVTGAPGVGTLAFTGPKFQAAPEWLETEPTDAGSQIGSGTTAAGGAPSLGTLAVGGAPTAGTLAVGSGMAGDAPAHLFIGSLLVRF